MSEPNVTSEEAVPSELLRGAAEAVLPDIVSGPVRNNKAQEIAERPSAASGAVRTPTALERRAEIQRRLKWQDEHDAKREAELRATAEQEAEELLHAERVAQAIQIQEMQLQVASPPESGDTLSDDQLRQVELAKVHHAQNLSQIQQKKAEVLEKVDPSHRVSEAAKYDIKVVEATGKMHKAIASLGIAPATADQQVEATLEAKAEAERPVEPKRPHGT